MNLEGILPEISLDGILKVIGASAVFLFVYESLKNPMLYIYAFLVELFMPNKLDLAKRFGDWAAVTGCTDGIGKYYAMELAKKGINIVLISRNPDKLKDVAEEIENLYNVKTKIVEADFSKGFELYAKIEKELEDVPIGILVNNVGIAAEYPKKFCREPSTRHLDMININILAMTKLVHMILPRMIERGRGVVVNTSSVTSWLTMPNAVVYSATKAYIRQFTFGLREDYANSGVHFQLLTPSLVVTKMLEFSKFLQKSNIFMPTPATYSKHAVATLGKLESSSGYWGHGLMITSLTLLPEWIKRQLVTTFTNIIFEYDTNE